MPSAWPYRPLLGQGTLIHHILVALLHLGDGHLRPVPYGQKTSHIPTRSRGLLHQVDRGRAISHHHHIKGPAIHMATPHMNKLAYDKRCAYKGWREDTNPRSEESSDEVKSNRGVIQVRQNPSKPTPPRQDEVILIEVKTISNQGKLTTKPDEVDSNLDAHLKLDVDSYSAESVPALEDRFHFNKFKHMHK
ncbi:hypothetical protein CR513_08535, partial [Mucuna pruriens]